MSNYTKQVSPKPLCIIIWRQTNHRWGYMRWRSLEMREGGCSLSQWKGPLLSWLMEPAGRGTRILPSSVPLSKRGSGYPGCGCRGEIKGTDDRPFKKKKRERFAKLSMGVFGLLRLSSLRLTNTLNRCFLCGRSWTRHRSVIKTIMKPKPRLELMQAKGRVPSRG